MKISNVFKPPRRAVYIQRFVKSALRPFRSANATSTPVFVFGMQRSGTSMLMSVFHLRADTDVYDENKENRAFDRHRLRDSESLRKLIDDSWANYVCFKPIADSHRSKDLLADFPSSRAIWIYRDYRDAANSRLRKFQEANRAIRLVCQGASGGGWFDEGISDGTREVLRSIDREELSDFDYACLTWWARNRVFIEQGLMDCPRAILVNYEKLVENPEGTFKSLFAKLGMGDSPRSHRYVHRYSVGKNTAPNLHPDVRLLCQDLKAQLQAYLT